MLINSEFNSDKFSKLISVFKFGTTFKTTKKIRFPIMVEALTNLDYQSPPIVLDVGASDGITSHHIIQSIDYDKYFITDLNTEILYEIRDGKCYFYDKDNSCILIVTKLFVIYSDVKGSIFPFNKLAGYFFSKPLKAHKSLKMIELINPAVKTIVDNILITQYDIFKEWPNEKVDLIIAANILNNCYFPEKQIKLAIMILINALNDGGRFVIVDSRDIEKGTIFQVLNKGIKAEKDINGGTE